MPEHTHHYVLVPFRHTEDGTSILFVRDRGGMRLPRWRIARRGHSSAQLVAVFRRHFGSRTEIQVEERPVFSDGVEVEQMTLYPYLGRVLSEVGAPAGQPEFEWITVSDVDAHVLDAPTQLLMQKLEAAGTFADRAGECADA